MKKTLRITFLLLSFLMIVSGFTYAQDSTEEPPVVIVYSSDELLEAVADSSVKSIQLGDDISVNCSDEISINGLNKSIDGASHTISSSSSLIFVVNDGSVVINNIEFDTNEDCQFTFNYGGSIENIYGEKINIISKGTTLLNNSEIRSITLNYSNNCSITNSKSKYISIDRCNNTLIKNVELMVPDYYTGIRIEDPSATIEDVTITGGDQGIYATQVFNGSVSIKNVNISGCSNDGIINSGSTNGSQLYLSDVTITDVGGHAIYCTGGNRAGYIEVMENSTLELDSQKIAVYLKKGIFAIDDGAEITESKSIYTVFCDTNSSLTDNAQCLTLMKESGAGTYYDLTGKEPVSLEGSTLEVRTEEELINALTDENIYNVEIKKNIALTESRYIDVKGELKCLNGNNYTIEVPYASYLAAGDYFEVKNTTVSSEATLDISLSTGGSVENVHGPVNVYGGGTTSINSCTLKQIDIYQGPKTKIENIEAERITIAANSSDCILKDIELNVPDGYTGMHFDGMSSATVTNANIQGGSIGIQASFNGRSATLNNVNISGCSNDGIFNSGGTNGSSLYLSDVTITDVGGHAIYCTGGNRAGYIEVMENSTLELDSQKIAVYLKKGIFAIDDGAEITESKSIYTVFCDTNSSLTDNAQCLTLMKESGAGTYYDLTGKEPVSLEGSTLEVRTEEELINALTDENIYNVEIKKNIALTESRYIDVKGELKCLNGNNYTIEVPYASYLAAGDYFEVKNTTVSSEATLDISLSTGGSVENVHGPVNVYGGGTTSINSCTLKQIDIYQGPKTKIENIEAERITIAANSSDCILKDIELNVPDGYTGMHFDGMSSATVTNANIQGGSIGIQASFNGRSATLNNVNISGCSNDGIFNSGGTNGSSLYLSDVTITDVGGHAIYCTGGNRAGYIEIMENSILSVESTETSIQLEKGSISINGSLVQSGSEYAVCADPNSYVNDNNRQLVLIEQNDSSNNYYKTRANYNDVEPPIITLKGEDTVTISFGTVYVDEGATVTDNLDDDLDLTIDNQIDYTSEGKYFITYSATDSHNNSSEIRRTIIITHSPSLVEAKEATCTEDGNIEYYSCDGCGQLYTDASCTKEISPNDTVIEKLGHNWGEWTVTAEATCTEDGSKEKVCSVCEDKVVEVIPAKGHTWSEEYTTDKAATCKEEGSKSIHCSVCGVIDESTVTVIPKADHTYGEWTVTAEATCTEDGSKEKVCSVCEDKVTETIPAKGHSFSEEFTVDTEPTCTTDGSKSKHCANCDEVTDVTVIPANGHEFAQEFTVDTEPTCTAEGSKSRHCANCDVVVDVTAIPKSDHTYGEWTVTAEATCTEDGSKEKVCSVCEDKVTETIPAKGHSFSEEFTVDTEPTCTTDGSKSKHCANCDEVTDITAIPANGHSFGPWEEITPSTCTNSGVQQHVCGTCGFTETKDLDPNGHDWEEEVSVDVEPTCTKDGSQSRHCKNCDAVIDSEVIPATGHSGEWKVVKASTCTAVGSKERTCAVCGNKTTEEIPAKGHSWNSEPTVDKAATCTATGSQSVHCARCSETKDAETIPALGHSWGSTATVDKAPTCTKDGQESTHCTRCDAVKEGSEKAISATGHRFSAWTTTKTATEIATGEQSHKCTVCGKTETKTIAQLSPTLPAVKIAKPKAAKKSAAVKWKKVSKANQKKIAKIQIQYSLDKTFKTGVKTVYAKKSAASKKITKLTSKKTYYVRIRAYKSSGGVIHVSKWSTVKSVKAK